MKKSSLIAGLWLFFATAVIAQTPASVPPPAPAAEYNPASWKQFTSTEGGFTIAMPGIATASTNSIETDLGRLVFRLNAVTTSLGEYDILYCDFPVVPDDPQGIKRVLDGARDKILSDGSRSLLERDLNFEGHAGRELIYESGGTIVRQQMFFVKRRMYVAIFGTAVSVAFKNAIASSNLAELTDFYQATCERFFGSLKLIPSAPAAIPADEARAANNGILTPVTVKTDLYPANADAQSEIDQALKQAARGHKRIMLVFGANWCYDCHVLDRALHEGTAGEIMKAAFILVHVDIGEGNKNLDLLKKYKIPLEKGVPAVALLESNGDLLYSSGDGEFEAARRMMKKDLVGFLQKWKEHK